MIASCAVKGIWVCHLNHLASTSLLLLEGRFLGCFQTTFLLSNQVSRKKAGLSLLLSLSSDLYLGLSFRRPRGLGPILAKLPPSKAHASPCAYISCAAL